MSKKTLFFTTVSVIFVIIIALSGIVVYYDPFFHYHKPLSNVYYEIDNQAYQNPGIARNFDYDSVIVGSSMTELLHQPDFDKAYGCDCVKLSYSGAMIRNCSLILEQAFEHQSGIKTVFWGLDLYSVGEPYDSLKQDLPMYLYDDNYINDFSYILNKEVLIRIFEQTYQKNNALENTQYKKMYDWNPEENQYNSRLTIENISFDDSKVDAGIRTNDLSPAEIPENYILNMENNILPLLEINTDTRFVFFIPPYPAAYWYSGYVTSPLKQEIIGYKYIFDEVLKHDNAEIHFLPLMSETSNFYLYKDVMHYSDYISHIIPETLKNGTYKVTNENVNNMMDDFLDYVLTFDYGIYTGEIYPFRNITEYSPYLEAVSNTDYIKIIEINDDISELTVAELDVLKNCGLAAADYCDGYFFAIIDGNKCVYSSNEKENYVRYNDLQIAPDICINGIKYVSENKMLNIVVYDRQLNQAVDVAGMRDDLRLFTKY